MYCFRTSLCPLCVRSGDMRQYLAGVWHKSEISRSHGKDLSATGNCLSLGKTGRLGKTACVWWGCIHIWTHMFTSTYIFKITQVRKKLDLKVLEERGRDGWQWSSRWASGHEVKGTAEGWRELYWLSSSGQRERSSEGVGRSHVWLHRSRTELLWGNASVCGACGYVSLALWDMQWMERDCEFRSNPPVEGSGPGALKQAGEDPGS